MHGQHFPQHEQVAFLHPDQCVEHRAHLIVDRLLFSRQRHAQ